MKPPPSFALFETRLGVMAIVWRGDAVIGLRLPDTDQSETRRRVRARRQGAEERALEGAAAEAAAGVVALAAGEKRDLTVVAVELPEMDEIARGALLAARAIPPGETRTYGEIARGLGDVALARRVGQAMARNPVPVIIPCHRVMGEGGKLTGFSAPGGLDTKLRLLEIEGALKPSLFADLPFARKKD
jgi:methylated-DNA-[protein]-cysteine S-methyltransferase